MELQAIDAAAAFLRGRVARFPRAAVVLGSGLSDVLRMDGPRIGFSEIPNFPEPTVAGHAGILEIGEAAVLRGRAHHYEGHPMELLVRPVRVLARLGVEVVVLTNAAGAVNPKFRPGDLMLITDHLNLLGGNPLRGPNLAELGPRFPDLSDAYDPALRKETRAAARSAKISLRQGVYAAVPGPSYETPAEIRMVRRLGADAVGMSTVPEAIAARHAGLRVVGISTITNLASGLSKRPLHHDEVLETNREAGKKLDRLLRALLGRIR